MAAPVSMVESSGRAIGRGIVVHVGLAIALLVVGVLLGPVVRSVAADVGVPLQTLSDSQLLAVVFTTVYVALALGASLWTGVHYGGRNPGDAGTAILNGLVVALVGVAILAVAAWVGLRLGVQTVAAEGASAVVSFGTLIRFAFLVVPGVIAAIVGAGSVAALGGARPGPAPAPEPEEPAPEPEPEPEPAGGGEVVAGAGAEPAAEPEPETKKLKCPSCAHVFETEIGDQITCPECGYSAQTTA